MSNFVTSNLRYIFDVTQVSITEFSKRLGLNSSSLYRMLGRTNKGAPDNPRAATLKPLCDVLGVTMKTLKDVDFKELNDAELSVITDRVLRVVYGDSENQQHQLTGVDYAPVFRAPPPPIRADALDHREAMAPVQMVSPVFPASRAQMDIRSVPVVRLGNPEEYSSSTIPQLMQAFLAYAKPQGIGLSVDSSLQVPVRVGAVNPFAVLMPNGVLDPLVREGDLLILSTDGLDDLKDDDIVLALLTINGQLNYAIRTVHTDEMQGVRLDAVHFRQAAFESLQCVIAKAVTVVKLL